MVYLLEHNCKNCVGTGGCVVHFCGGCGTIVVAKTHVTEKLSVVLDGKVCEIFDVRTFSRRFADFEVVRVLL